MAEWFYEIDGKEKGPVSSEELKRLAAAGTVRPDARIRKGADGTWVTAEHVKGLFTTKAEQAQSPTPASVTSAAVVDQIAGTPPPLPTARQAVTRPPGTPAPEADPVPSVSSPSAPEGFAGGKGGRIKSVFAKSLEFLSRTTGEWRLTRYANAMLHGKTSAIGCGSHSPKRRLIVTAAGIVIGLAVVILAVVVGLRGKPSIARLRPEEVLERYAKASSWRERLRFVKPTKGIEDKMRKRYGDEPISFLYDEIEKASPSEAKVGEVVTVNAVLSGQNAFGQLVKEYVPYYLQRTEQGYLILWEASTQWTPMAWKPYKAARPCEPMDFPLVCTIETTYYQTKENIKNSHYSISVCPPKEENFERVQAFVVRDSPAGKKIFEILSDGEPHEMILTVQFREGKGEDCLWVTRLVSDKPWVYDDTLADRFISPILVQESSSVEKAKTPPKAADLVQESSSVEKAKTPPKAAELPFEVSEVVARWTVDENVLGGKSMVVPELRFRVTAKSETVSRLTVKIVYLEKQKDSTEIMYEDVERVVGAGDSPLEKGLSKTVLSKSGRGYQGSVNSQRIVDKSDVTADLYYDVGDGYIKLMSVVVQKVLVR